MKNSTDYGDSLKRIGLKNTKQRAAILDVLEKSNQPIAAEQIYQQLKEQNVAINICTVYRTLEALADNSLATKLSITGDSRALFECNKMVHRHYLICTGCKKILAINSCPLGAYEEALEKETHFKISGHKLNIYGFCPQCQESGLREEIR